MRLRELRGRSVRGQRVFVRAGFNVPFDSRGRILDDWRIERGLPTLRWLLSHGASVVIGTHIGRPKGKVVSDLKTEPIARFLSRRLQRAVLALPESVGPAVERAVARLVPGQIALLENLRFHSAEEKNQAGFARQLARLADVYVDDAFENAHRQHASMVAITRYLPSLAGFLLAEEVATLERVMRQPRRPLVTVIGGAKISTKLGLIRRWLPRVDYLLLGGALANTILKAQGLSVGQSLIEPTMIDSVRRLRLSDTKLKIPIDVVVARSRRASARGTVRAVGRVRANEVILDVGQDTVALFSSIVKTAKTIIWNGPLGFAEVPAFARGTRGLARAIAASKAESIVGGGETIEAIRRARLLKKFSFVSTGGGAMLEFLEGKRLPALQPLLV